MNDLNRILILLLLIGLLYALYLYQQKLDADTNVSKTKQDQKTKNINKTMIKNNLVKQEKNKKQYVPPVIDNDLESQNSLGSLLDIKSDYSVEEQDNKHNNEHHDTDQDSLFF